MKQRCDIWQYRTMVSPNNNTINKEHHTKISKQTENEYLCWMFSCVSCDYEIQHIIRVIYKTYKNDHAIKLFIYMWINSQLKRSKGEMTANSFGNDIYLQFEYSKWSRKPCLILHIFRWNWCSFLSCKVPENGLLERALYKSFTIIIITIIMQSFEDCS